MTMNKLIMCTVGTSIANGCPSQKFFLTNPSIWDDDTNLLEEEIQERIKRKRETEFRSISAEINSIDRLKMGPDDKVVLLSSDNAPGKACSKYLKKLISEHYSIPINSITIERINGLQVYNSNVMKRIGLKNLISTSLKYIADKSLSYQYDIIINPTGGFKGILPFLTILGMLYGKKTIYIFEHSEELIYLPPLPFSFDINLFERVRPALKFLENEIAVTEDHYLSKVINFTENERELFLSFVEPFDDKLITISPLAHCLLSIENSASASFVLCDIVTQLRDDSAIPALAVKRLISKSSSPLWRNAHSENWPTSDLIILKQKKTAERIAGFLKHNTFYVTHAFKNHDEYEQKLGNCFVKDYKNSQFEEWIQDNNIGNADDSDCGGLVEERDALLIFNKKLQDELTSNRSRITELSNDLDILKLENEELAERLKDKRTKDD